MGVKLQDFTNTRFEAIDKINTSFSNIVRITRQKWE